MSRAVSEIAIPSASRPRFQPHRYGPDSNASFSSVSQAGDAFTQDHPATQVHASLTPLDGEPVIRKHRFSSFYGTPLSEYMRRAGADTLVVAGVSTANCAITTAVDGTNQDYKVIVLADSSCAIPASLPDQPPGYGQHWEALRNIQANHGDVLLSTEFLEKIGA